MLKRFTQFLFFRPGEIGFENYLVLVMCALIALTGYLGIIMNSILNLGWIAISLSAAPAGIFTAVYIYSRVRQKYSISKYLLTIVTIVMINIQWAVNYGSTSPIPYLFVVLYSFIFFLFHGKVRNFFTLAVILNVVVLIAIEIQNPNIFGQYENDTIRLVDMLWGLLMYFLISIILLTIAMRFYKNQQEKAQTADRLKSSFLANMSHEIRTPMNGILGFTSLLKDPEITVEQQHKYIKIIEESGVRLMGIINDIVDISKIESGLMEVNIQDVNIHEITEYLYDFFNPEARKKGIHLSVSNGLLQPELWIKTDKEKLYAILTNLLKNAILYTQEGSVKYGYRVESNIMRFFVIDTGPGIPKFLQDVVFERFMQADAARNQVIQGTGLGLSITKAYVEMLGGRIHLESIPGKGSEFYFTIPFSNLPKTSGFEIEKDSISFDDNYFKDLRILIAEDDLASILLLEALFPKTKYPVLKARTGLEVVEMCKNNPDLDFILMDIRMPELNGYEATKRIRAFNKTVKIIAQTAHGLSGDKEKALEAGCNDYISKPVNINQLLLIMKNQLDIQKH